MRSQRVNYRRARNRPGSGGSFLVPRASRNLGQGCGVSSRPGAAIIRVGRAVTGDRIMSGQTLTRRATIAACGALALVTLMRGGVALAQSRVAVVAIRVDVAPLRANAGDPTATWVEQELPRQLAEALSGRLTPKGGTLTVSYLTLGPNTGATIHGGSSPDNIIGVATIGSVQWP